MLTNEQIKNLKHGDPILIHTTFDSLSESGNIRYFSSFAAEKGGFITDCRATDPSFVSLPPKHDPSRLFKKGDIVRLREYNGRPPYDFWHKQVIKNFGKKLDTVLEDEKESGNVDIFQDAPIDELTVRVNSCHLELITPVEDLEPYSVKNSDGIFIVHKKINSGKPWPVAWFLEKTHPNAEAAAEAECARLNAENRKAQEND